MVTNRCDIETNISTQIHDKEEIASLISRLGTPPNINLLDSHYKTFKIPDIEGFIGYRIESEHAIVLGDPVCTKDDMPALVFAFNDHCQKMGWRIIYVAASEQFSHWALENKTCRASFQFGEEFVVDPANDPTQGRKGEKLRWKMHKAIESGIVIKEYRGHEPNLEKELKIAADNWLKARKGPQVFLSEVDIFSSRYGKRWFYASLNDAIVGIVIINRLETNNGAVLNMLMPMPNAPVGTSECLMMTVIEKLRIENCNFFCLGATTVDSIKDVVGLSHWSALVCRGGFKIANWYFGLRNRKHFLKKFFPYTHPYYILFSHSKVGLTELMALKKSMNISLF